MIKNVISVIDGEAGSCGKAKVIGEIASDPSIKLGAAVTNCMPNAGHTFVDQNGKKIIFRNIPVSSVNPNTELFIGPGSAIDMEVLEDEYERTKDYVGDRKIYVHEMVPLIEDRHKEYEKANIKSGSTFKGCGAVTAEKVLRNKKLEFFKTFKNAIVCSNSEWLERLYRHLDNPSEYVLLEGAQGCDLDLNHSGNFPYVTSRNVSTAQLLADCGISAERLLQTIMVIRPFPIRISNITNHGDIYYSGGYGTGEELTWTQVNLASIYGGYPYSGDVKHFVSHKNPKLIKKFMAHCPDIYLKQVLGEDYRYRSPESLSLLEALELERLMYKRRGKNSYTTRLLDLSMYQSNLPENYIFDQSEETSVSKMERRIFDLDIRKLMTNVQINTPSSFYLNFLQHLNFAFKGQRGNFEDFHLHKHLKEYINWLEVETGVEISTFGTGAKNGERIIKSPMIKEIEQTMVLQPISKSNNH